MTWTSRQRLAVLMLCSAGGLGLGLLGDVVRGDMEFHARYVVEALLLSPIAVAFGGSGVTPSALAPVMLLLGLAFWPVYLILAARLLRAPVRAWLPLATVAWCAQGFFQVLHRVAGMSV